MAKHYVGANIRKVLKMEVINGDIYFFYTAFRLKAYA